MRRRQAAGLLVAGALAVAGCGGGGGQSSRDESQIRSTLQSYYQAFANGDAAKACSELASQTRTQFEQASGGTSCPKALARATQRPEVKKVLDRLKSAKVGQVQVSGDVATASVQALGRTTTVPLVKENGAWRIRSPLGG